VSTYDCRRQVNNKPDINKDTKRAILQTAEKLGYRPNRLARGLRSNKTYTIGVIVADISNPFFGAVVKGIQDEAQKHNYSIILQGSDEEYDKEVEAIQVMLAERVDGLLITPVQARTETIKRLGESDLPFVLLARQFDDLDADYVVPDNVRGGFLATEHLISLGHERIALVNAPLCISSAKNRLKGYKKALTQYGIDIDESLITSQALTAKAGYRAVEPMLRRRDRPTAVFTYSDFVAFGVMKAIRGLGLRIPEDIAVVGFDDIEFSTCLEVPLTTIRSPKEELGRKAIMVLNQKLTGGGSDDDRKVTMGVSLIVRRSTCLREATLSG
jgi:LacI family transcriptional regulator